MSSVEMALGRTTGISRRKTLWIMLAVLLMVGSSFAAAALGMQPTASAPTAGHSAGLKPFAALAISGSASPATITKGSSSTIRVTASGGTSPYTYAWTGLPTPCTATSSTTSVSCAPTYAGTDYITVWVTDSTGAYTSTTITLQVVWAQLTISSFTASSNPVVVNLATTITASVTGGAAPYTYAYTGVPTGCTASTTSSWSCTPTATGAHTIQVTVTDSGLNSTSALLVLSVRGAVWATLSISSFTSSSNPAYVNNPTTISVAVTGGASPYSYAYTGAPTGCTASTTSSWSCTPSAVGVYTMDVKVTDSGGNVTSQQLQLKVLAMAITSFTVSPNPGFTSGPAAPATITFTAVVQGAIGAVTYSWTGLPPQCPSANSPTISCVTSSAGQYTVEVFATDSATPTPDTANQTITEAVHTHLIGSFTVAPNPDNQGLPTTFSSSNAGFFGLPTYTYTGLPTGCASANASTLRCVPTTFGSFPVTLTVTDWKGNTSTATVTLTVSAVASPTLYVVANSTITDQAKALQLCQKVNSTPFFTSTCYSQSSDPSVLSLPNNITGIAYQVLTENTNNTCHAAAQYTNSRIVFAASDSGVNVANPLVAIENTSNFPLAQKVYLGNYSSCNALNAIEPSFTRSGTGLNPLGTIYGVYIAENSSSLPVNYGTRTGDMLEFVSGTIPYVGGVVGTPVFSTPKVLDASGNLALPQVKSVGNTIYVVYEDIANSSTPIPGGYLPISVKYIYSTTGGATWIGPVTLPGQGKAEGFNAMAPSITTSAKTGMVAVTYATNRGCDSFLSVKPANCLRYGESVVVYTSTMNGTSWVGPSVAATNVTESMCYTGNCLSSFYQATPETAIAFSPDGTRLFVAWAGATNLSSGILPTHYPLWYRWTGIGVAQSTNFGLPGATWTGGLVPFAAVDPAPLGGNTTNYFRPALGVSPTGSNVYLAYSMDNETAASVAYPGPWNNSLSEWVANAPVLSTGPSLEWNRAAPVQVLSLSAGIKTNSTRNSFSGYRSSIAFTPAGVPLIGFSVAQFPTTLTVSRSGYYSINTTYGTNLSLAELSSYGLVSASGSALVTNVTFTGVGLPTNPTWQFMLNNQIITSVGSASLLISNVPRAVPVYPAIVPYGGGGAGYSATVSTTVGPVTKFNQLPSVGATVSDSFSVWVGFTLDSAPSISTSGGAALCSSGATYCYIEPEYESYHYFCNPAFTVLPNVSYEVSLSAATPCYLSYEFPNSTCSTSGYQCEPGYCDYLHQIGCEYVFFYQYSFVEYDAGSLYVENISESEIETECTPGQTGCTTYTSTSGYWYFENVWEYETVNGVPSFTTCVYRYGSMPDPFPATAGCSYTGPVGWFTLGDHINLGDEMYSYDWASPLASVATYANSTSPGGFTGPLTPCPGGNSTNCPGYEFAYYYYWNIYGNYACQEDTFFCNFVPVLMEGPVTQTAWFLSSVTGSKQTAPQEITPVGLPAATPYTFTYAGTTYNAIAPAAVLIKAAPVGVNEITGAKAHGPPGYTYYATNLSVEVPQEAFVNLTFSTYVETGAAMEQLTFHAPQIPTGTQWGIAFNGTVFASATPYINVTAHPGNYAVTGWNVTAVTGDANYTPDYGLVGSVAKLMHATTQLLNYSAVYRVAAIAPTGGLVQIGSGGAAQEAYAWVSSGTTVAINAMASSGFDFQGWTGVGTGAYTGTTASDHITVGSAITETASFYRGNQASDTLTFTETTLPAGTWWTILVNGVGYSSNTPEITVANVYPCAGVCGNPNALGHYDLTVEMSYSNQTTSGTRYVGTGPAWVSTNGTTSAIAVSFLPQFLVNVQSTPGGTVSVLNGQALVQSEPFWANNNSVVTIQAAPNAANTTGHWAFESWVGTGSGSYSGGAADESGTVTVNGPITEVANFMFVQNPAAPEYTLTVTLGTTLAAGTSWSINVGSNSYSSTNTTLVATQLLKGTYSFGAKDAYSPDGTTRYVPSNVVSIITITSNKTVSLSFTVQYWVDVQNSTGGAVLLSSPSGAPQASAGWFTSGTQLVLGATPGGPNELFTQWVGTGTGSYTGTLPSGTITVSGPITEVAGFIPKAPAANQVTEYFNEPVVWVALAVVGIVVGLAVGMLLFRRGGGSVSSGGSATPHEVPASKTAPEYSEEQGGEP
jgi:hypothetical protein